MKRSQVLLAGVGAVLLIVVFFVLLFQPARQDLAEVEERIAAEQATQQQLTAEIARLREVRSEAPEVEAQLAAGEAIIPRDPALPSALRQLQLAADESGIVLTAVTTARPTPALDESTEGFSQIGINVQLEGGYFQLVDFLRRVEDPTITPRGLLWNQAALTIGEYPSLSVSLSGSLYAVIVGPVPPVAEEAPDPDAEGGDPTNEEADVDVEVDVDDAEEIS
jgi:Tfp pilus assembly protein PilO